MAAVYQGVLTLEKILKMQAAMQPCQILWIVTNYSGMHFFSLSIYSANSLRSEHYRSSRKQLEQYTVTLHRVTERKWKNKIKAKERKKEWWRKGKRKRGEGAKRRRDDETNEKQEKGKKKIKKRIKLTKRERSYIVTDIRYISYLPSVSSLRSTQENTFNLSACSRG